MKRIIALILALSVFGASAVMPVTVSADTTLSGALALYADKLNDYMQTNKSITKSIEKYKFALAYIDGDNVPDLIVSTDADGGFKDVAFYFASGSSLKSDNFTIKYTSSDIYFVPKQSNVYYEWSGNMGYYEYDFYRWTGSAFEKIIDFSDAAAFEEPYEMHYYIDQSSVSEDYYKSRLSSMKNQYNWSEYTYETAFEITSSNISGMKQNYQKYVVGETGGSGIRVILDGEELYFTAEPYIENGVTMVPMRAIFEALGASVNYEASKKVITAVKGSKTLTLTVNSPVAYINGQSIAMQSAAVISNGSTMVPLRFVSENLDADVEWNGTAKTITITSN